jgi:hypothetical protein
MKQEYSNDKEIVDEETGCIVASGEAYRVAERRLLFSDRN